MNSFDFCSSSSPPPVIMPFRMSNLCLALRSIHRPTTTSTIALVFLLLHLPKEAYSNSGWSFLPNQQHCRLTCLNGGVCAYEVREPSNHKCICFIGMWSGEQCEIPVGSEEEGTAEAVTEKSAATGSVEVVEVSSTEEGPLYQLPDIINSGSVGNQQSSGSGGGEVRESEVRQHPVHHVPEEGEHVMDIAPDVSTTDEPKTTVLNEEEEIFESPTMVSPTENSGDDEEEGTTAVVEDSMSSSTLATMADSSEEKEEEEEGLDVAEETTQRQSAARDGVVLLGGNGVTSNGRVESAEYVGAPYTSTVVQYENKRTSTTQRMGEVEEVTTSSVSWRGQDPAPAGGDPYHQPPPRPKKKKKSKAKSVGQANADSTANSPSPPSPPRYDTGHSWMTAKSARGAGSHAPSSAVALMPHRLFGTGGMLFAIALPSILIRH